MLLFGINLYFKVYGFFLLLFYTCAYAKLNEMFAEDNVNTK
jgi:hypothetical protein